MNLPLSSQPFPLHDAPENAATTAQTARATGEMANAGNADAANQCALREHFRHVRETSYAPATVDVFRVH